VPKLKASYDQQADIPTAYSDLYTDVGGKWVLDAEGIEDVAGLRSALARLKAERTELKKDLERYKDVDLEAYETLRSAAEDGDKKKTKSGKASEEEAYAKRLKDATTQLEQENQRMRTELARERITSGLKSAALAGGIREDAIDSMVDVWSSKVWRLDDKGNPRAFNGEDQVYGRTGEPLSMPEFVEQELKAKPFLQKTSSGQGANHQGRTGSGTITLSREEARDVNKYEAAKKRAQETGAQLAISA
jgi:hypothetical protein